MIVVEFGIVDYYDGSRGKQFGKINVLDENGRESGERLFFHLNFGRWVTIKNGPDGEPDLVFAEHKTRAGYYINSPKQGDRLAFMRMPHDKGDMASPWTPEAHYLKKAEELKNILARNYGP